MPAQSELKLTAGAAYVHMTSNNTIEGTQWKSLPEVGDRPLVSDTSSDMFSRRIDVSRHALIYAGAQKNMGPAGVTVVIVRDDLLQRSQKSLPTMLNYAVQAENKSLYNTRPAFAVYALGLVMKWLIGQGVLGERGALGTDTFGPDPGTDAQFRESSLVFHRHRIDLENMTNLDQLPPHGFTLSLFPVKWVNTTAAPVRAVAIVEA